MLDRVPIIGRYLAACASATERLQRLAGVWMLAASLQWPGVRRAFHNQQSSGHTHKGSRYQRIRARGLEEPNATIGNRASRPTQESLNSQRPAVVPVVVKSLCAASYFNPMPNNICEQIPVKISSLLVSLEMSKAIYQEVRKRDLYPLSESGTRVRSPCDAGGGRGLTTPTEISTSRRKEQQIIAPSQVPQK